VIRRSLPIIVAIAFATVLYGQARPPGKPGGTPGARRTCDSGFSTLNELQEEIGPDASPSALAKFGALLRVATDACPTVGDFWYFRSLVDRQREDTRNAAYALARATALGSPAARQQVNPFAPPRTSVRPPSRIRRKFAVIVGIDRFSDGSQRLPNAASDARAVAQAWSEPGIGAIPKENVTLLVNEDATLAHVSGALRSLWQRLSAEDLVIVYVASRGLPRKDSPNGISFIQLYDTKTASAEDLYNSALALKDVLDAVAETRAARSLLLLDTGAPGGTPMYGEDSPSRTEFNAAADRLPKMAADGPARVLISARRAGQQSLGNTDMDHGLFAGFLKELLRTEIPIAKLFEELRDRTARAAREWGAEQMPVMRSSPMGLALIPGAPASER
jgi:hypothetical protein